MAPTPIAIPRILTVGIRLIDENRGLGKTTPVPFEDEIDDAVEYYKNEYATNPA